MTYSDMYKYSEFDVTRIVFCWLQKKKVKATYIKEDCNIRIILITMLDNKILIYQLIIVCNSVLQLYFCCQI